MGRPQGLREENGNMPEDRSKSLPPPLEAGDYYMEGPYMVFTAAFHLKRGYCCGSKCRHCPYEWSAVKAEADQREGPVGPDGAEPGAG